MGMGAVSLFRRRPARKVLIFQCPCGFGIDEPRAVLRPRALAIFVVVPVFFGHEDQTGRGKPALALAPAPRAAATSGRLLPGRGRGFFKVDAVPVKEPLTVEIAAASPRSSGRSRISTSVRSGTFSTSCYRLP